MIYFCPFRWCNIVVVLISTFEKDMSKANGDACKSLVTTSSTTSADQSPKMVSSCKINGCSTGKFLVKKNPLFSRSYTAVICPGFFDSDATYIFQAMVAWKKCQFWKHDSWFSSEVFHPRNNAFSGMKK